MNSADLKALQDKLNRLGYNTGGGDKCGASLVANNSLAKDECLTTAEALSLMRDGLRWRAYLSNMVEGARVSRIEVADEHLSAL